MIWNRATRYTPYNDWPTTTLKALKTQVKQSQWRMKHHIQPDSGLLNDPNGFSYFNNEWHLFYQIFPYGPVHGLKSWQHLTSKDLIDWKDEGLAIQPDSKYDSHGAYTGTALPVDDKLFIMYTGNVRDQGWNRKSFQLGAYMDAQNKVNKLTTPLIEKEPNGYTSSFRDPYLIKHGDFYYAIIGAQTEEEKGAVLIYKSRDLNNWQLEGPLKIATEKTGFMVECPNLIFIDNKPVFVFCPQGLDKKELDYQNIYPNVYFTADAVDLNTGKFKGEQKLEQLDDGFDVYATQVINAPDGRALAVSWIGLPEIDYPTDSQNWAHCLSLVKELTLQEGHLYQNPVSEIKKLRQTPQAIITDRTVLDPNNGSFELELTIPKDTQLSFEVTNTQQTGTLKFNLDSENGTVSIDRAQTGNTFGQKYGQTRKTHVLPHQNLKIRLIIDVSVFECYIDNGYSVMTGRFFLDELPNVLKVQKGFSNVNGTIWEWRK